MSADEFSLEDPSSPSFRVPSRSSKDPNFKLRKTRKQVGGKLTQEQWTPEIRRRSGEQPPMIELWPKMYDNF